MNRDELAEQLSQQEDLALTRRDRAAKARHLLESGLVKEAFEGVRQSLLDGIATARLDQNVDDLRRGLWALEKVRGLLQKHIESGKLAERDLDHIMTERRKLGIFEKLRRTA